MNKSFFDRYTQGLTPADFQKLFTRDRPEAYRYFTRHIDRAKLDAEPWFKRWFIHTRLLFIEFAMRLSPARRILYGAGVAAAALGMLQLFRGFGLQEVLLFPFKATVPFPQWVPGTVALFLGFAAVNLLILMEVADRLSLKGDLEIAREIQFAMLPGGIRTAGGPPGCGARPPARTAGGDC